MLAECKGAHAYYSIYKKEEVTLSPTMYPPYVMIYTDSYHILSLTNLNIFHTFVQLQANVLMYAQGTLIGSKMFFYAKNRKLY